MIQSGIISFHWNQVIGMIIGALSVVAIFFAYGWHWQRRKIARNERPPQRTKILRPPGYSASCQLDEISDQLSLAVMISMLAGVTFGAISGAIWPLIEGVIAGHFTYKQIYMDPNFPYLGVTLLFLLLTAVWMAKAVAKSIQLFRKMRNFRFGMRGEQAVAEGLADKRLITAGYVTFHDVPGDGQWNIDHVVIGPSGIYVLETKTRPRRKPTRDQADKDVIFDGKILQFPWCYDAKAVKQARYNAHWVRQFIAAFAPENINVQPVIVVPGWCVKSQGNYPVKAMPVNYLVDDYLLPAKREFSPEQLRSLICRFEERCRSLEF